MPRFSIAIISIALAGPLLSQTPTSAPRPAEHLGVVHFPTSCSPTVSAQFDRAVALLHSFEFGASIKGFEQVLVADSSCAMAHWGIALSRWSNPMAAGNRPAQQLALGQKSVASARSLSSRATERERQYIAAVAQLYDDAERGSQRSRVSAYEQAMARLSESNPADTEAKIFYALSQVGAADPSDKTYAKQRAAGKMLETLWAAQPNHPGLAHYIIHAYDYPALASSGGVAASSYASIAPSAAHALHMPSHIFTRTGEWKASVATNKRSMDVALSTASIAEALHAADYTVYAYLQLGLDSLANEIFKQLPSLISRFDPKAVTGAAPGSAGVFAIAAIPARFALERDQWHNAETLEPRPSSWPWTEAMTYFARAIGSAHTGNLEVTEAAIDSLSSIQRRVAALDEPYWAGQVEIQRLAATAWLTLRKGDSATALDLMRQAVAREDATEKSAVTPGPLAPARELLGDMLMEYRRPGDALVEYKKTIAKEPNRRRSLTKALAAARSARDGASEKEFRTLLDRLNKG